MPDPYVLLTPGALDGLAPRDVVVPDDDADRHLRTVLRLRPGAAVQVGDGAGTTVAGVLRDDAIELADTPVHTPRARPRLRVVHALPKGRKLDEVVRTLTELGVDRITPVSSARSVVRLEGAKADRARQRWRAVARSAVTQSRRAWLPDIDAPADLDRWLAGVDHLDGVVAHVGARASLRSVMAPFARTAGEVVELCLAVGPEGGWTDEEADALAVAGLAVVGLGPTVLRTEHAASALTAVAAYALGRFG